MGVIAYSENYSIQSRISIKADRMIDNQLEEEFTITTSKQNDLESKDASTQTVSSDYECEKLEKEDEKGQKDVNEVKEEEDGTDNVKRIKQIKKEHKKTIAEKDAALQGAREDKVKMKDKFNLKIESWNARLKRMKEMKKEHEKIMAEKDVTLSHYKIKMETRYFVLISNVVRQQEKIEKLLDEMKDLKKSQQDKDDEKLKVVKEKEVVETKQSKQKKLSEKGAGELKDLMKPTLKRKFVELETEMNKVNEELKFCRQKEELVQGYKLYKYIN